MFDSMLGSEVRKLWADLPEAQRKEGVKFADQLERMSGIFGCPQLWTIHKAAWLLHLGHKLEHCEHETAAGLLGVTADRLTKFHELLKEKHV